MTITDELVEKARGALLNAAHNQGGIINMRAALEAVAPALIAQGMREAFAIALDHEDLNAILDRAQEIDPK